MKKYIVTIIIAAALLLWVVGAVQYFLMRYGAEAELMAKASRDMAESKRVEATKSEVESAIRNLSNSLESNIGTPNEQLTYIVANLVEDNPHIVGAGIAFAPDYYRSAGKEGRYAPYAYDDQPAVRLKKKKTGTASIRVVQLPFDYTEREWYRKPMADGKSLWTEPYVDQGGTHIIMCTYAEAISDSTGKDIGVFFADVPMEDVSLLSMNMHQDISRSGYITLALQLVSLLVLGIIIWRAVQASKRYKERLVDPEKDRLIEELEKLRGVNRRLTERNMELAKKVQSLHQTSDAHWFG